MKNKKRQKRRQKKEIKKKKKRNKIKLKKIERFGNKRLKVLFSKRVMMMEGLLKVLERRISILIMISGKEITIIRYLRLKIFRLLTKINIIKMKWMKKKW